MSAALFLCIVYRRVAPHYLALCLRVSSHAAHTLGQKCSGGGKVDTHKSLALNAIGRTGLHPYAGVSSERLRELSYCLPTSFEHLPTVCPCEIGAFEGQYAHSGDASGDVIAHTLVIGMYVSEHSL